jgi:hypothetical protein
MLNVTNKANKLPSLIDKCCHHFFAKYSQNEKSKREFFFFPNVSFSEKQLEFFCHIGLSF